MLSNTPAKYYTVKNNAHLTTFLKKCLNTSRADFHHNNPASQDTLLARLVHTPLVDLSGGNNFCRECRLYPARDVFQGPLERVTGPGPGPRPGLSTLVRYIAVSTKPSLIKSCTAMRAGIDKVMYRITVGVDKVTPHKTQGFD